MTPKNIEAALQFGDGEFKGFAPPLPPPMPDWSPVRYFGGYQDRVAATTSEHALAAASCRCASACGVHGQAHAKAWSAKLPVSDEKSFWGALGCSCWAF